MVADVDVEATDEVEAKEAAVEAASAGEDIEWSEQDTSDIIACPSCSVDPYEQ